jgi:hypothetical protein
MNKQEYEVLLFTINEKAEYAFNRWHEYKSDADATYWRGQYTAFTEVYTLLSNQCKNL